MALTLWRAEERVSEAPGATPVLWRCVAPTSEEAHEPGEELGMTGCGEVIARAFMSLTATKPCVAAASCSGAGGGASLGRRARASALGNAPRSRESAATRQSAGEIVSTGLATPHPPKTTLRTQLGCCAFSLLEMCEPREYLTT